MFVTVFTTAPPSPTVLRPESRDPLRTITCYFFMTHFNNTAPFYAIASHVVFCLYFTKTCDEQTHVTHVRTLKFLASPEFYKKNVITTY
jgi:hypothetical protein